jgi:hypothetical protein
MRFLLAAFLCLAFANVSHAAAPPPVEQWIVVVPSDYEKAVAPLIAHRKAQGLRVAVVRVGDELSFQNLMAGDAGPLRDRVRKLWAGHPGRSSVLLVGAVSGTGSGVVPALKGTAGRMRGQPSDAGYGCEEGSRMPTVAVGRFPARNAGDAKAMVDKTIALERDRKPGAWRRRLTVLAGIPAYNPVVDRLVESIAFARFDRMNPVWTGRAVYTADGSRFCLPDKELRPRSLEMIREGQAFVLYLGHSDASGLYGGPTSAFLDRDDWAELRVGHGGSVFITFGCNGCQQSGRDGEGYGIAAARNPRGPVAVIGSHGICFASMVQLACDGLFRRAFQERLPDRLGDCWLAALEGVSKGPIDFLSYRMLDRVDGDPRIPQATQRQEHLEMFALLGDPALRLPQVADDIALESAIEGDTLAVRGTLPERMRGAKVHVSLERSPASIPLDLEAVPAMPGPKRDRVLFGNHRKANRFEVVGASAEVKGTRFAVSLDVPKVLPKGKLRLRIVATTGDEQVIRVQSLEAIRRGE